MLRWFKRIAITLLVVGAIGAVFASVSYTHLTLPTIYSV